LNRRSTFAEWIFSRQLDQDLARAWRWARQQPVLCIVALGIVLRLIVYLQNRSFWMDEASLWGNIKDTPVLEFSKPLKGHQLAPHAFLIAERALVSLLRPSRYAARLLPLAGGIVALLLFSRLVRYTSHRRAGLVALVLFACSDDLIYYSSELKPYSIDLAIGLAVTLLALSALANPLRSRRLMVLALVAVAAPWCSFASAFIIAGSGATLVVADLLAGRRRDALLVSAVGLGWCLSFLISYRAAQRLLIPGGMMYRFWYFAFLPLWPLPMSVDSIRQAAGILLEVFVNPLNLVAPVLPWLGVIFPVLLVVTGGVALGRRSWATASTLILPILLGTVASAAQYYPLHGRLMLEFVPAFYVLAAEGSEAVRQWDGTRMKLIYKTILILLLAYPCLKGITEVVEPTHRSFNQHGDLHDNVFLKYDFRLPGQSR
jgi:hypothetical protein